MKSGRYGRRIVLEVCAFMKREKEKEKERVEGERNALLPPLPLLASPLEGREREKDRQRRWWCSTFGAGTLHRLYSIRIRLACLYVCVCVRLYVCLLDIKRA